MVLDYIFMQIHLNLDFPSLLFFLNSQWQIPPGNHLSRTRCYTVQRWQNSAYRCQKTVLTESYKRKSFTNTDLHLTSYIFPNYFIRPIYRCRLCSCSAWGQNTTHWTVSVYLNDKKPSAFWLDTHSISTQSHDNDFIFSPSSNLRGFFSQFTKQKNYNCNRVLFGFFLLQTFTTWNLPQCKKQEQQKYTSKNAVQLSHKV